MTFKTISNEDEPDYEIWTCDTCGYEITLAGTGGDVAECPRCISVDANSEWEDHASEQTRMDAEWSCHSEEAQ